VLFRSLDTGVVTVFTVAAGDGDARTRVRMSSEWETAAGLRGLADRLLTPPLMGRVFARQLRQLDRYMRSGASPERSAER